MAKTDMLMVGVEKVIPVNDVTYRLDMLKAVVTSGIEDIGAELKHAGMAHYAFSEGKHVSQTRTAFVARIVDEVKRLMAGKPPCRRGRSTATEHTVEELYMRGMVEWFDTEKTSVRVRMAVYGRRIPN